MKNTIIGISFLYFGAIVCLTILGYGFKYSEAVTEWNPKLGKLWSFIWDNYLLIPFVLSLLLTLFAIALLLKEYFSKK